jgi:hypothetical protein
MEEHEEVEEEKGEKFSTLNYASFQLSLSPPSPPLALLTYFILLYFYGERDYSEERRV